MALIPLALFYLYAFCCTFFGLPIVRIQFPMPQLGCLWTCLSTRPRAGQGAAWRLVRCPGSCPFAFAWEQPWAGFLGGALAWALQGHWLQDLPRPPEPGFPHTQWWIPCRKGSGGKGLGSQNPGHLSVLRRTFTSCPAQPSIFTDGKMRPRER